MSVEVEGPVVLLNIDTEEIFLIHGSQHEHEEVLLVGQFVGMVTVELQEVLLPGLDIQQILILNVKHSLGHNIQLNSNGPLSGVSWGRVFFQEEIWTQWLSLPWIHPTRVFC